MSRKLTEKQSRFVAHASRGVSRTHAARLAGLSAPAVEAYRLMRLPHVVKALKQHRDAALKGERSHQWLVHRRQPGIRWPHWLVDCRPADRSHEQPESVPDQYYVG